MTAPMLGRTSDTTLTERLVGQIWSHVLGIPQVNSTDSFFHLGGQSREGVQVLGSLRERLGIELGLADLLRRPVLRDLAVYIDESRAGRDDKRYASSPRDSGQD
jgi:hypothetical protein